MNCDYLVSWKDDEQISAAPTFDIGVYSSVGLLLSDEVELFMLARCQGRTTVSADAIYAFSAFGGLGSTDREAHGT